MEHRQLQQAVPSSGSWLGGKWNAPYLTNIKLGVTKTSYKYLLSCRSIKLVAINIRSLAPSIVSRCVSVNPAKITHLTSAHAGFLWIFFFFLMTSPLRFLLAAACLTAAVAAAAVFWGVGFKLTGLISSSLPHAKRSAEAESRRKIENIRFRGRDLKNVSLRQASQLRRIKVDLAHTCPPALIVTTR